MNLHLIFFFLIRLALAVNLPDSKPDSKPPVRKCNSSGDCDGNPNQLLKPTAGNLQDTIKSVKQLELVKPDKPPSGQHAANLQAASPPTNSAAKKKNSQRKRTSIGVRDVRGDAKLSEFILRLNKELYEKVRKPPADHNDQINRLKIAASDKLHQHDQQHSNEHNAQHAQLKKQNNEYEFGSKEQDELSNYLKEQKVKELQRQAFDSLQQIFEIDLPANPTFNQKFIELISALLSELRHIKSRLWQANCKMRLSFTNQQIFSDCETNHEEPCNCPKNAVIEQPEEADDKEEDSGEQYQAIQADKRSIKPNSGEQEKSAGGSGESLVVSASSDESTAGESLAGGPLTKSAVISATNLSDQNQTETSQRNTDSSESKRRSASKPAVSSETAAAKSSPALITSPSKSTAENKSKKETELSKQLRSAIDCFLCKHQWTNCLNYGIKCPAE